MMADESSVKQTIRIMPLSKDARTSLTKNTAIYLFGNRNQ
jgi:hypothetical protein